MVLHWALLIVLFGNATANDCDPCEYGRCDRGGRQHCINFNNNDYPRYHCILPNSTCPPSKKCFEYKNYLLYTENKECLGKFFTLKFHLFIYLALPCCRLPKVSLLPP